MNSQKCQNWRNELQNWRVSWLTLKTNKASTRPSQITQSRLKVLSPINFNSAPTDFNINQLIKHRNDLKLKMDKIKEDMENGLVDDKEKLKYLALTGSQIFKVFFPF